jgi:threonine dehydrogenase-like Zn-dependent dehydrogenase
MSAPGWPGRVAILGSGTMGAGFAQLLALGGVRSTIVDATPEDAVAGADLVIEAVPEDPELKHTNLDAAAALHDGDTVTIDTAAGSIVWDGGSASLPPQPPFIQELLAAGGIVEWARHRLEQRA